jgi:hypothetical protein
MCQVNSVHTFPPYFPKIHSYIIILPTPRSYEWFLPVRVSHQNFVCIPHLCYTRCLNSSRSAWLMRTCVYPKSFRTRRLERELRMVHLSAIRCSCIDILWVNLVSFAAITLYDASQWLFIIVVYFVIDSVRKLLDIPSYMLANGTEDKLSG